MTTNNKILTNIINNIELEHFTEAQKDCALLPKCQETTNLYATIGAIDSQPTIQAFDGTKSAAVALADRLIGRI